MHVVQIIFTHLNDIIVAIIFQYKQKHVPKIDQYVLSPQYVPSTNYVELGVLVSTPNLLLGHLLRDHRDPIIPVKMYVRPYARTSIRGATENTGVENAIRAKMQGWKMQEYRLVVYGKPNRDYTVRQL